jgi:hypothetical protein
LVYQSDVDGDICGRDGEDEDGYHHNEYDSLSVHVIIMQDNCPKIL